VSGDPAWQSYIKNDLPLPKSCNQCTQRYEGQYSTTLYTKHVQVRRPSLCIRLDAADRRMDLAIWIRHSPSASSCDTPTTVTVGTAGPVTVTVTVLRCAVVH